MIKNCKITIRNFIIFLFIIRSLDRIINKKIESINIQISILLSIITYSILYSNFKNGVFVSNTGGLSNNSTESN